MARTIQSTRKRQTRRSAQLSTSSMTLRHSKRSTSSNVRQVPPQVQRKKFKFVVVRLQSDAGDGDEDDVFYTCAKANRLTEQHIKDLKNSTEDTRRRDNIPGCNSNYDLGLCQEWADHYQEDYEPTSEDCMWEENSKVAKAILDDNSDKCLVINAYHAPIQ